MVMFMNNVAFTLLISQFGAGPLSLDARARADTRLIPSNIYLLTGDAKIAIVTGALAQKAFGSRGR
jgi:hypothetical protein